MPSAADFAWLIPVLPLVGALITGLGLISFNRTINRLKKPVALLLISCIGAAAVISYAVLFDSWVEPPPLSICSFGRVLETSAFRWDTSSTHLQL